MSKEVLILKIGKAEINEKHANQFSEPPITQKIALLDEEKTERAVVDFYLYPDGGFYSFYWDTKFSAEELVEKAEECLFFYEGKYDKPESSDEKRQSPYMKDLDDEDPWSQGIIVWFNKDGETDREEITGLPSRPFSLANIAEQVGSEDIRFLRLNTAVGDFCINPMAKVLADFGVLSNITHTEGFEKLARETSSTEISEEDMKKLLSEAVKIISTHKEKTLKKTD